MQISRTAVIDDLEFTVFNDVLEVSHSDSGSRFYIKEWKELAQWLIDEATPSKKTIRPVDDKQLPLPGRYVPTTPVVPLAVVGGVDPYEDRKAVRSGVAPINGIVQEVDLCGIAMESRTVSAGTVKVSI